MTDFDRHCHDAKEAIDHMLEASATWNLSKLVYWAGIAHLSLSLVTSPVYRDASEYIGVVNDRQ